MSKSKESTLKKVFSVLLAVVLLIGMIPDDFVMASGTDVVVCVTDGEGNPIEGAGINYEITDSSGNPIKEGSGQTDSEGKVTVLPATEFVAGYKLTATITKDGYIVNEIENREIASDSDVIPITLELLKDIQVNVEPYKGTYDGKEHPAVTLSFTDGSQESDYDITYKVGDSTDAVYELPKVKEAKKYKVTVIIERDDFKTFTKLVDDIEIKKANQSLNFNKPEYEDDKTTDVSDCVGIKGRKKDYDFSATPSDPANTPVSYSVEKMGTEGATDSDVAVIDDTGKLTVKDAGTFKVTAKLNKNDNYEADASITHTLKVKAKPQEKGEFLSFGQNKVSYVFGANNGEASTQKASYTSAYDTGAITYSIDKTDVGLTCDKQTGKVTISDYSKLATELRKQVEKKLSVTVTADKATTELYAADKTSYSIEIGFEETPQNPYTIEGKKTNQSSKWYTGNVSIKPSENYGISYTVDGEYTDSVAFSDNNGEEKTVYLKKKTGGITDVISVNNLYIDTKAPTDISVEYSQNVAETVLGSINSWYNTSVDVTIKAKDATSGVDKFVYQLGETGEKGEITEFTEKDGYVIGTVTLPKSVPAVLEGKIKVTAYDKAGNSAEYQDDKYIAIDTVKPGVEVEYSEPQNEANDIRYYRDSATITPIIKEDYFDASFVEIHVKKDGNEYTNADLSGKIWRTEENQHKTSFTLTEAGDYIITIQCKDYAKNEMEQYQSQIRIDKSAPEIKVICKEGVVKNSVGERVYYDKKQTAEITITDHNFDAESVDLKVRAKDASGSDVTVNVPNLQKAESWKNPSATEKDTWVAEVPINTDANYELSIQCKDMAGNDSNKVQKQFTVDGDTPSEPTISYSESVLDKVIAALTFGYYKAPVTVTLTSSDETAGVDYFEWSYTKQDGASDSNKPTTEFEKIVPRVDQYSADGKEATVSFTLEPQARGHINAKAYDKAGNSSVKEDKEKIVVVDTIAPDVKIAFSGDALQDKVDVDKEKPTRQTVDTINGDTRFVYNSKIEATLTASEANFYEDMEIVVKQDGNKVTDYKDSLWKRIGNTDSYERKLEFEKDGDYVIIVNYADRSGNDMNYKSSEYSNKKGTKTYTSNIHTIDTTAPVYGVSYDNNKSTQTIGDREYYGANRTATITLKDRNFRPNEVEFAVEAKDISGDDVDKFRYSKLVDWKDWTRSKKDKDTWISEVTYSEDANYDISFSYTDIAGNKGEDYKAAFSLDKVAPTAEISYSEPYAKEEGEKYYNTDEKIDKLATVTLTAFDKTSGVQYFKPVIKANGSKLATDVELPKDLVLDTSGKVVSGTAGFIDEEKIKAVQENGKVSLSFDVPAQFRGVFELVTTDNVGNISETCKDGNVVVVDTIAPNVQIAYSSDALQDKVDVDKEKPTRQTVDTVNEDTRFVYNGKIEATITASEANFYEDMEIVVKQDGKEVTDYKDSQWKHIDNTDQYERKLEFEKDGDYVIVVNYADRSGNDMDYESGEYSDKKGTKTYTSNIHTIDTTAPVYEVSYDNNEVKQTISDREYYGANRTATITVKDRNFRPNEVEFAVEAKDISGDGVDKFHCSKLVDWKDWTRSDKDEDTWSTTVSYSEDANYDVALSYTDIAKNKVEKAYQSVFTVDKMAPTIPEITYSESIIDKVFEILTFGFYNPNVVVTMTSSDEIAGIDHFEWSYTKQDGASDRNKSTTEFEKIVPTADQYSADGKKATVSFTMDAQARGHITAKAYDRTLNNERKEDSNHIQVVDSVSPEVSVTYKAKDEKNTKVHYVNSQANTVKDFTSASQAYYSGSATATIAVNEANFFEGRTEKDGVMHEIGILLTKTDNGGNTTKIEYMPEKSTRKYPDADQAKTFTWGTDAKNPDIHTMTIDYEENADYVLTFEYVDLSTNKANIKANDGNKTSTTYTSKIVTVDKISPTIKVEYSNTDKRNTIRGRKYFDAKQTATITVMEHNFRADDVAVDFEAKNVINEDVKTLDYAKYLSKRSSWKHFDSTGKEVKDVKLADKHVATISYDVDANYSFDIEYKDLSQNKSANYSEDKFTVDKTVPKNLKVSYSTSVFENVLNAITFGYYDEQVTVTISAEDETSGIWHYMYSYINEEGVSSVNAQRLDQAIRNAHIEYSGKKGTATFKIPKSALGANNQFNGNVEFTAYDRAENNSEKKDKKRIVVDNISPTGVVEYNEPVQTANDVVYYDKDISATIKIQEANFYAEDVEVLVTKDEQEIPVTVDWTDDSVDSHTGTFNLHEDGDYLVTINYADRSTNKMSEYVSERMTIDTNKPVINVTNIMNESANNQEKIGMSISVTDKNIAMSDFQPQLTSVIKESTGKNKYSYKQVGIDLGKAKTSKTSDGETTYTYTVENLDKDGYYSLACSATDYANHKVTAINTESKNGQNSSVDRMNFSVNRKGSVFWVETEHNDKYSNKTYTDKLDGAYANDKIKVKLHEINVDKVDLKKDEEHKTIFTLNDGSEAKDIQLTEKNGHGNGNYKKNVKVGSGGWYENTYTLNNENFDHDGVYSINIVTYDQAENSNVNTKSEEGSVKFTLDRTKPVISSNISNDQQIKATEFPVEFAVAETNLDTDTIQVKLNGKTISPEEIGKNEYRFNVSDGLNQSIEITTKDLAGNESELYKVDDFTISTNIFVLWYANTVLFWSSIGGGIFVIAAAFALIMFRKRRSMAR